ncbi:MAG: SDR family oxidoreductase [Armatimonadia bacterium]
MMILVTGATGTVGRYVVAELLARKVKFVVGARHPEKVKEVLGPDILAVPLDFDDPASLKRAMQSAKKIYLLTPGAPPDDPQAKAVIDAAREAGVEHIVRQSALGADASPGYTIGQVHRAVELYLLASGMTATILRPNHFMENLLGMAGTVKAEGKLYSSSGEARMSMIAAKDIGAVAAHVLTNEGFENQSYDLTGPEAVTYGEIADAIGKATARNVQYVSITDDQAREAMGKEMPEWVVEALVDLAAYDRSGGLSKVNKNVEMITGKVPQDVRAWALEHAAAFV